MKKKKIPWENFIAQLHDIIVRESPSKKHLPKQENDLSWDDFIAKMHYNIEHDDKELLNCIEEQNNTIESLNNTIAQKDKEIAELQKKLFETPNQTLTADNYMNEVLEKTRRYIKKNGAQVDVRLIRDLFSYIYNKEYLEQIQALEPYIDQKPNVTLNNIHGNDKVVLSNN